MDDPEISVVIPTYNYAHLIARAVDSVLSQWSEHIELIVINDGSTDNTAEVLATLTSADPRVRVITQANAGAATARNTALAVARGKFALLLDADDELCPNAVRTLLDAVTRYPDAGLVIGGHVSVFGTGQEKIRSASDCRGMNQSQRAEAYLLTKKISISHGCSLFLRSLLLERPYPTGLTNGEDIPVFAYCVATGPVITVDVPLARIYKHPDSLRHSAISHPEKQLVALVDAVFEKLPPSCQSLKRHYAAKRWQSLSREMLAQGIRAKGLEFFRKSLRLSKSQFFQRRNLKKFLIAYIRTFRRDRNESAD